VVKKTVSAMEARRHFGELLEGVFYRGDEVTIERAGKVMGVVVSPAHYANIERGRSEARARFFEVVDEVRAHNATASDVDLEIEVAEAIREARANS